MIWWFLILAFSAGAVLWVGLALYFRLRSQMKVSDSAKNSLSDVEHEGEAGSL